MANISKINVNNNEYKIKDAVARGALGTLTGSSAVPTALNNKVGYADYRTVTESGATKHYIYFYKNDSDAPTNASTIPSTYLCKIDAAPFIKDGMVSSVAISNGDLVITWNSDSTGVTSPTSIPLSDIFDPHDYYDKDEVDGLISGVQASIVDVVDNLTTQDPSKALSANQGYVLDEKKANKSELSIAAITGKTDRKNVQLKSGVSQEFLIAHQDISGKADKSSTVSNVAFDSTTGIISQTVNGESYPIITFDALPAANSKNAATSGGIYLKLQDKADKSEMSVTPGTGANSDKTTIQLKSDTSATVLTAHQSLVGYINEQSDMWNTVVTAASQVGNKVDKVTGKGLSTNDYTTDEKTKLAGIAAGAEVNVQSDWNQTTTTADDYIKNKPTNVSAFTNDAGYQTSSQVTSAISSAVSGSYTASTETLSLTLPTFTTA